MSEIGNVLKGTTFVVGIYYADLAKYIKKHLYI